MILATRLKSLRAVHFASALACLTCRRSRRRISGQASQGRARGITALNATDVFDGILPGAAAQLKQQLIGRNPDLEQLITTTVDERCWVSWPSRRPRAGSGTSLTARVFTEDELKQMATFFASPAARS